MSWAIGPRRRLTTEVSDMMIEEIMAVEIPEGKYKYAMDRLRIMSAGYKNTRIYTSLRDSLCAAFEALYKLAQGEQYTIGEIVDAGNEAYKRGRESMLVEVLREMEKIKIGDDFYCELKERLSALSPEQEVKP